MIRSYLLIFTPVFAAGVLTGWIIPWWLRQWRAASAVIAGLPVPYVPTDKAIDALAVATTCLWCRRNGPRGRCTCGVWCGHRQCPRLTRADLEYLDHGTEMPR